MRGSTRLWAAGSVGAVVLIAAGGYLLGVQPALAQAEQADAATAATEAQIGTVQAKVAALSKVAATQSALEAKAEVLGKAVPSALQGNTFIRRLNTVAAQDGLKVQSVSVGAATAYKPPTAATTTPAAGTASPAPSASASAAPAPAVAAAPALAATDPLITSANLTVIPMTVAVKGTTAAGLQLIKDLQRDERLFLISGFTTAVDESDASSVLYTLTGSIYVLKA